MHLLFARGAEVRMGQAHCGPQVFRLNLKSNTMLVLAKARGQQVFDMTLSLDSDAAAVPLTVDFGRRADNRQYKRVLSVVQSQVKRLCTHGVLGDTTEYDLTDPWIDDSRASYPMMLGGPFLVLGAHGDDVHGGQLASYLGVADGEAQCRMWPIFGEHAFSVHRNRLVPVPVRPARQGEWALLVNAVETHRYLVGRRGLCGARANFTSTAVANLGYGTECCAAFWVNFEPPQPDWACDVVCLPAHCLVAFPGGGELTPWEQKHRNMDAFEV